MDFKTDNGHNSGESENFAPEYRDRLRTWLEKMINSGNIPGLCWENKEQTIFRMPWKHAGRQDYNLEEDSKIFMAWAVHSGRYREGVDKPEPIVWKTRLRCALNKMPDIRELPERSRLDISEPYRVYQLLPPVHKASQIRRRLYKRSQSHETDQLKPFPEHSSVTSLVNSPTKSENDWGCKIVDRRRNSSIEATRINVTNQQTSPLTSVATATTAPAFWFPSSANLSLKSPISTTISNGMHIPQPLNIDPSSTLQSLTHSTYPLVSPLHNPFTNFSPSNISPLFTATSNLEAYKRLSFLDQSFFARHKYQEQLTNFARKFEENQVGTDRSRIPSIELKAKKVQLNKLNSISDESYSSFSAIPTETELAYQDSKEIKCLSAYPKSVDIFSLEQELRDCRQKIENLEKSLETSRNVLEQERSLRRQLEEEKKDMKMTLDRMNDYFRTLALHIQPNDEKFFNAFSKEAFGIGKRENVLLENQTSKLRDLRSYNTWNQNLVSLSTKSIPANLAHRKSAFVLVQNLDQNPNTTVKHNAVKRASSPLDLTINSPNKKQRDSCEVEDRSSHYPIKYSPSLPSFVTSLNNRNLSSEEKRPITSPSSVSSCSPDSISIQNTRDDSAPYEKLGSSPIQHSLQSFPQRHGTIQVT